MTTDLDGRKQEIRMARPAYQARGSSGFPEGWPDKPVSLPRKDRPIVAKNLADKARLIGRTPSIGAKLILDKVHSERAKKNLVKHRCFDLPSDEKKGKPGRKESKGKSETDVWIAKTSDYRALAKAAFKLIHPNDSLEGFKWSKFEREVFEGTSLLTNKQAGNISTTSTDLVLGLTGRLVAAVKSTGIDKFWQRLSDTPFDVDFHFPLDEDDEEHGNERANSLILTDDQVLSLGLGKLVHRSPLDVKWQIGEVQPQVEPYWAEVSIELGRVAVPRELWVLEIPRELRSKFAAGKRVPLPGFEPEDGEDVTRFPDVAHDWLLENAWNGTLPDSQWDLVEWLEDDASDWKQKTFHFDCRLMLTVVRGPDGEAQMQLKVRPSRMDSLDDRILCFAWGGAKPVLAQLQDPDAGHSFKIHRINEDFWPEIIYDDRHCRKPIFWSAFEMENAAEDLRHDCVINEFTLSEALDLLRSYPFVPSIKVSEQARSRQFPRGTVLDALFANLSLGDSPERIDRLLKAQAQAITEFGNNHLDELVHETQSLLDQLDQLD